MLIGTARYHRVLWIMWGTVGVLGGTGYYWRVLTTGGYWGLPGVTGGTGGTAG